MEKFLFAIEFRYYEIKEGESHWSNKTITIGVFDTFEEATVKGNEAMEVFENYFKLNPNYNKKERFSKNGGCFGSRRDLITNLSYLQTPFQFYAKITTLKYVDLTEAILNVLDAGIIHKAATKNLSPLS